MFILITGYVGSPTTPDSRLVDESQRTQETIETIRDVVDKIAATKIFVSLTGDINQANQIAKIFDNTKVSFGFFPQDPGSSVKGKGYFEYQLLRRSLIYWKDTFGSELILKITAKYKIGNLEDVCRYTRRLNQPLVVWKNYRKDWVDTRCFAITSSIILEDSIFLPRIDEKSGSYFETAIFSLAQSIGVKMPMFIHRPIVRGLSGTTGQTVQTSRTKRTITRALSLVYDQVR